MRPGLPTPIPGLAHFCLPGSQRGCCAPTSGAGSGQNPSPQDDVCLLLFSVSGDDFSLLLGEAWLGRKSQGKGFLQEEFLQHIGTTAGMMEGWVYKRWVGAGNTAPALRSGEESKEGSRKVCGSLERILKLFFSYHLFCDCALRSGLRYLLWGSAPRGSPAVSLTWVWDWGQAEPTLSFPRPLGQKKATFTKYLLQGTWCSRHSHGCSQPHKVAVAEAQRG